ncbi:hypothetical protein AYI68_g4618 [Smittium mucronatum]|uniref:Uncharacterized protein n=1 Tax=Smittium mucronatum TaxID=133383 RepID=A0A1R0GWQ3_9FUNG|nr:hypothetical protein AYI68_g4618 [Smittium mucronatum]
MLVALFLATKVENVAMNVEDFVKSLPKVTSSTILDLELPVSLGLKFEFKVVHPYTAAYGRMDWTGGLETRINQNRARPRLLQGTGHEYGEDGRPEADILPQSRKKGECWAKQEKQRDKEGE